MSSITRLLCTSLVLLLSGAFGAPAEASTILYRTDAQLIAGSQRVVHARVIGKRATRGGPNQSIYTVTTLQVIEDFTGVAGDIIETWELGGVLGNEFLYVGGSVEYQVGQEVVVCLERGSLGYRSVAMGFSKFDVEPATGALRRNAGAAVVVGGALSLRERNLAEFRELARQTTGREPVAGGLSAAAPVAVESDPFTLLGSGWRWPVVDAGTPITWFKNTTAAPPITTGDGVPEILATMSAWTTPSTARITLTYGGATSQALAKGPFTGLPVDSSGVITFEDPGNEIGGFTIAIGGGSGFLGSGGTVNGHHVQRVHDRLRHLPELGGPRGYRPVAARPGQLCPSPRARSRPRDRPGAYADRRFGPQRRHEHHVSVLLRHHDAGAAGAGRGRRRRPHLHLSHAGAARLHLFALATVVGANFGGRRRNCQRDDRFRLLLDRSVELAVVPDDHAGRRGKRPWRRELRSELRTRRRSRGRGR